MLDIGRPCESGEPAFWLDARLRGQDASMRTVPYQYSAWRLGIRGRSRLSGSYALTSL